MRKGVSSSEGSPMLCFGLLCALWVTELYSCSASPPCQWHFPPRPSSTELPSDPQEDSIVQSRITNLGDTGKGDALDGAGEAGGLHCGGNKVQVQDQKAENCSGIGTKCKNRTRVRSCPWDEVVEWKPCTQPGLQGLQQPDTCKAGPRTVVAAS